MGAGYHGGFGSTNGAKKQGGTGTQAQWSKTVKLLLDYLQGPIWKSDSRTGKPLTGINIIDNDVELPSLNFECCQLYSSCYHIDSQGHENRIDREKLRNNKNQILYLLDAVKKRLESINDGSYVVKDLASEKIRNI